ncbi:hypothetical protein Ahy_A04g020702 isoform C [Arachis hypogaea]|uniref:Callose synthase helical domain-containing protein n=1 Tax=Arachis hypogaea TaxID=3818 RepID=A0A445DID8_ARAHY|nr:hypothetical protein Ahy_A04g020702 isoform C [Arachis hypogaea]
MGVGSASQNGGVRGTTQTLRVPITTRTVRVACIWFTPVPNSDPSNISTNSFISLNDSYMYSAVVECYETLKDIIYNLLQDEEDKMIVSHICDKVEWSIQEHTFVKEFKMSGLPSLSEKLEKFLTLLRAEDDKLETLKPQIVNVLQDIVEIILQDEVYRIKLSGLPVVIGEGKPENQNHAIIFTRGEALQTIDMNQTEFNSRMAVTHADLEPNTGKTCLMSSKTGVFLVLVTILLGLSSFTLCLIAEATRSQVTWMNTTPLVCAACAFVVLAMAMVMEHTYLLIAVSKSSPTLLQLDPESPSANS